MQHEFLQILKEMRRHKELNYSDVCVMAVIVTEAQYKKVNTVELSIADIQAEFEMLSTMTIRRSLQRLINCNFLEVIKTKGQKNKYRVLIDLRVQQSKDKPTKQPQKPTYKKHGYPDYPDNTEKYIEFQKQKQHEFVFGKGESGEGNN